MRSTGIYDGGRPTVRNDLPELRAAVQRLLAIADRR
jgi:hypothetical protein